jgi:hypothetical protein
MKQLEAQELVRLYLVQEGVEYHHIHSDSYFVFVYIYDFNEAVWVFNLFNHEGVSMHSISEDNRDKAYLLKIPHFDGLHL